MPILILIGTQRSLARSRCCDEFRDYVSAVGEESGCGEALREPERLLLAGVGAATSSFPPSATCWRGQEPNASAFQHRTRWPSRVIVIGCGPAPHRGS